jgi:hypothetical protein
MLRALAIIMFMRFNDFKSRGFQIFWASAALRVVGGAFAHGEPKVSR